MGRRKNFSNPLLSGDFLPVREQKDEHVWEGIKWVWRRRQMGRNVGVKHKSEWVSVTAACMSPCFLLLMDRSKQGNYWPYC